MRGMFTNLTKRPDVLAGGVIFIFAVVGFILMPYQIAPMTRSWGVTNALPGGHKLFPVLSLAIIAISSALLIISSVLKNKQTKKTEVGGDFKGFWMTAIFWGVYALGVTYIGYLISTFIMLMIFFKFFGVGSLTKMLTVAAGILLLVYFVFVRFMQLPFPTEAILF